MGDDGHKGLCYKRRGGMCYGGRQGRGQANSEGQPG
jgi:hypothetical protein